MPLLAVLAVVLSSCIVSTPSFDASSDPAPLVNAVATKTAADLLGIDDVYEYDRTGGSLTISAPATNTGGNRREFYWPSDAPVVAKEMSCQTWATDAATGEQQGIALRIAPTADGLGERAITVTKNIWYAAFYILNVHVWDTTTSPYTPYQLIAQFTFPNVLTTSFWTLPPYPWHVCARAVGNIFQVKVWTGSDPEPEWTDPDHVRQTTLPDGWDYPGAAGWYMGHLKPGGSATVTDLRTWSLSGTLDTTTTTSTTSTTVTTTSVPGTTTSLPESTTTSVPDTTTSVPQTTTSAPDTTTSVPESTTTTVPVG